MSRSLPRLGGYRTQTRTQTRTGKHTEKDTATMTSTADVSLEAGDTAKSAQVASAKAGGGGTFQRATTARLRHNTEDMHDVLDKSRFKNDPRLPDIKKEIAEMDLDGDGHLDQEEVATYILEHIDTEAAHVKSQKKAKRLGRML
jgi:hypothetical protein